MERKEAIWVLLAATTLAWYVASPCIAEDTCEDSVFAVVRGDTVVVHHTGAFYNCCAVVEYTFQIDESLIDIMEEETLPMGPCDCMCCFDLSVDLTGLNSGTYLIRVWNFDRSVLYGQVWVTVGGLGSDSVIARVFQSDCYSGDFDCGDVNGDGTITIADATYLVGFVYRGGAAPLGSADVNTDGRFTVADATYTVGYIYRGGRPPCDLFAESTPVTSGEEREE